VTKDEYCKEHFPEIDSGATPCGNQIIVQLRTVKKKSSGGIILAEETMDFNKHNTQVARLVKVGHIAFKHRDTGEEWKEGAWAAVGDVVVIPRYGGFRYELPIPGTNETAIFCVYADYEVKMVIDSHFEQFDKLL
jgi:co-chaperonin GroES (HSP10)